MKGVAIALKSSFDNSLQEGLNSLEAGKFQAALKMFKSLEGEGSITPDLLEGIGRTYMLMGVTKEAIRYFRKAIKTNPNLLASKINLGISLLDQGEISEGVKMLKEVLDNGKCSGNLSSKTRARLVKEHVKLGETYVELGLSMEAIQEYKKAIRIGGDYPDIRRKMAREYIQINLLIDAERELKKALKRNPFFEEARADLGFLYMLKGRADLAREMWSQVESEGRVGDLVRAYQGRRIERSTDEPTEIRSPADAGEAAEYEENYT